MKISTSTCLASTCILSQNHLKKSADNLKKKKTFNVDTLFRIIHIKSLILVPLIRTLYSNRPHGCSHPCGRGCRHRSICKSSLVMFEKKIWMLKSESQIPIVRVKTRAKARERITARGWARAKSRAWAIVRRLPGPASCPHAAPHSSPPSSS